MFHAGGEGIESKEAKDLGAVKYQSRPLKEH